jgi:hypothetical protein
MRRTRQARGYSPADQGRQWRRSGHSDYGFVYVIEGAGLYKIGFSATPRRRLAGLQSSSPVELRLVGVIEGTRSDEAQWHYLLRERRRHGEWFDLTEEEVNHVLGESYGLDGC